MPASGVPSTCTRLLIGTDSGYGSRLASCATSAGALRAALAHADDAAAADLDAGVAHVGQRVEAVLVGARADDAAVELGRAVQVVVVVVEPRFLQRLGLLGFEHAQRHAGLQAQRLAPRAPCRSRAPCRAPSGCARPRPCRSAWRPAPWRPAPLRPPRAAASACWPRRRCRSAPIAGSSRSLRRSRRS